MQPAYLSKILSFNNFFEKLHTVSTFFWVWDKKSRAFSRKVFFRVCITWYRAFRGISWGKLISLSKKFFFLLVSFSWIEQFLCRFAVFSSRCVKKAIYVRGEKKLRKLTLKNCYSINFGLWAEKTWPFSKTVKHDSQNCSLRVQRNIFRNFPETTMFVWKFSVFEGKDQISCQKNYAGLPKAHFTCPEQHFEKKMIEVNFSVCGFFKSLRDFFFTDKKTSLGCQNDNLGVESKI